MENNKEKNSFQCYCGNDVDEYIREMHEKVCQDLPFYAESEGNEYCVLHHPSVEKKHDFDIVFQERLAKKDYQFQGVAFPGRTDFSGHTFDKAVDFTFAMFDDEADFSSAVFTQPVLFQATRFYGEARFFTTTFLKEANFNSAEFNGKVSFGRATFEEGSEISFYPSRFLSDVSLYEANIKGRISFKGASMTREYNSCFGENTYLNLEEAQVAYPEKVLFHSVRLHPAWFLNIDPSRFTLTNIEWENVDGTQKAVKDELGYLKKREGSKLQNPLELLAIIYRRLAKNAENNSRYAEASKFRGMAFEAEWLDRTGKGDMENDEGKRLRILKTIYDLSQTDPSKTISYVELEEFTKSTRNEIQGILHYFEQLRLIKTSESGVQITSFGIDRFEVIRNNPERPPFIFLGDISNNNFVGPNHGNISVGGVNITQNLTISRVFNPEFNDAIKSLIELVKTSSMHELDKEETIADIERVSELAQKDRTPDLIERAQKKITLLKSALEVGQLAVKAAPFIELLSRFFG